VDSHEAPCGIQHADGEGVEATGDEVEDGHFAFGSITAPSPPEMTRPLQNLRQKREA
jgi:hypothetical protein